MDLAGLFPGDSHGYATDRVADLLYSEGASKADYAIDLHVVTSVRAGRGGPLAFIPESTAKRSEEIATMFGACYKEFFLLKPAARNQWSRSFHRKAVGLTDVLNARGKPSFMAELGAGGVLEEEMVRPGVEGMLNLLKHLEMLEGSPREKEPITIEEVSVCSPNVGGILNIRTSLCGKVKKGDVVAQIFGFPDLKENIEAPIDGYVLRIEATGTAQPGDRVVVIGR
jgi:predicted deacylase